MNILSSFGDFYNNLSRDGVFFFWIIIFLFCFLVFLSIVLVLKNKKLIKLLKEEKNTTPTNDEIPVARVAKEEIKENKEELKETKIEETPVIEKKEEIKTHEQKKEETGPYKKNVLREMNARMQTSPINIVREEEKYNNNSYNEDYGLDESLLREESTISPLEEMDDAYEVNDNMKFASEIVEKMEEEIKPSNIELTDYERKQEEEAIISYDELLKVKDKIYNITEDEETDEFIDELKSFRLDL